jgi:hypothetical protein
VRLRPQRISHARGSTIRPCIVVPPRTRYVATFIELDPALSDRGYIGEREDTGVGVHERTHLKNGETYHVNNMRHSIRGRICADMRGFQLSMSA